MARFRIFVPLLSSQLFLSEREEKKVESMILAVVIGLRDTLRGKIVSSPSSLELENKELYTHRRFFFSLFDMAGVFSSGRLDELTDGNWSGCCFLPSVDFIMGCLGEGMAG